MTQRFCLVAGSGDLVTQVLEAASGRGLDLEVFAIAARNDIPAPVRHFIPADVEGMFTAVGEQGFTHVVLAGYVARETWAALQTYVGLASGESAGTAELARRLEVRLPAHTGAQLVGIHEIAPELIAPDGPIAGPDLTAELRDRARLALLRARELGWRDIGQAVVMAPDGTCEAEDSSGTDALLSRVAARGDAAGLPGWVLAKALKPRQPLSMDVPVIGPVTVENARKAGIGVIAVEAGGAVIVHRRRLQEAASAAGISVVGLALEPVPA